VIFGERMPPLTAWVAQFALPSLVAIAATYVVLRLTQHRALQQEHIARNVPHPQLSRGGRLTACGIAAIAVVLLSCSWLDVQLGLPTFVCGVITTALVLALNRQSPRPVLAGVSWGVLPLVAGLFVLVEALDYTGVIAGLRRLLHDAVASSPSSAAWQAGIITALASNLMNNLPVGLIAGSVAAADHLPSRVVGAMLIGVDLGPNLSVTGSLATILWLVALRREGIEVGAWRFLRLGAIVMPPALILALATLS
jgi:arsenical pump membrane protein